MKVLVVKIDVKSQELNLDFSEIYKAQKLHVLDLLPHIHFTNIQWITITPFLDH